MKILACSNSRNFVNNLSGVAKGDVLFTEVSSFADGERLVRVNDHQSIQGDRVLVVQSISGSVNDALMELLFALDVVHNLAPSEIYLLITYMGYSRQDRIESPSDALSSKVLAQLLSLHFINRLFVVDIHALQTLGFFSVPSVNLNTDEFMVGEIKNKYNLEDVVLISTDAGNVKSIITISDQINTEYSIAIKYRPRANENKILSLVGYDIRDKICIIVDDIVDSAGTLCNVAERLTNKGAKDVIAYITHPVLSGNAIEKINNSYITKLFISDSIDSKEKIGVSKKIQIFSIADWCLEKISRYMWGI
ncbi:MAG: ribose-phosphate diphosphokinase [Rickettsiales bacterium]|jgi:ribose-phosphate pyrophosphokinase|nr:ribose-phosphate diphosphokinase [Rickettsiales bacterium]